MATGFIGVRIDDNLILRRWDSFNEIHDNVYYTLASLGVQGKGKSSRKKLDSSCWDQRRLDIDETQSPLLEFAKRDTK